MSHEGSCGSDVTVISHDENEDKKIVHAVYVHGLDSPQAFSELCEMIRNASGRHVFVFYINCDGGDPYVCFQIYNAMKRSSASFEAVADGRVFSAAALLFLMIPHRRFSPFCIFNFHRPKFTMDSENMSSALSRLTTEGKAIAEFFEPLLSKVLLPHEHDSVIEGADVWKTGREVEIALNSRSR